VAASARLRFSELWRRLGATGSGGRAFDDLVAAYAEPGRAYHTLDHVLDCLLRLDESGAPSEDSDPVEAAIWFHDVVYDPRRSDNEARSAEWAARTLGAAGVPDATAERIGDLIRMTGHASPPSDRQGALLCDVDLSILGRDEQEFDAYQARIRQEYAWVPESRYRAARARILSAFENRDRIYLTEHFHDRYERQARANLRRALAQLEY
jgi:predicted metal-dependent HD superfamily phosphohydrolase